MTFASLSFLAFSLAAIAVLRLAPLGLMRDLALLAFNGVFLASFAQTPLQLGGLVAFAAIGFAAIQLCARVRSTVLLWAGIVLLVAMFAWLKQYPFARIAPLPQGLVTVIGLSYILFRVLHLLIDTAQGALRPPDVLNYINYLFFFPAFVSGPIQRYEEFAGQRLTRASADWTSINNALHRLAAGLVMVAVVSTLAADLVAEARSPFRLALAQGLTARTLGLYLVIALGYLVELYANFAGYMHIVIGIAALAGWRLPENFNRPFQSKNFMDFWTRWHMTLSAWFRTYLFNPLLKVLTARWPERSAAPYLAAAAFFVTFFVMGVWHGATLAFVVYGLFLGFGITTNRLWQVWAARWLGKDGYKRLCASAWYYQLSRAAALSYFTIALTCLWVDEPLFRAMLSLKGLATASLAMIGLTLAGAFLGLLWDRVSAAFAPAGPDNARPFRLAVSVLGPVAAVFALAAVMDAAVLAPAILGGGAALAAKAVLVTAVMAALAAVTAGAADPGLDALFARSRSPSGASAAWMGMRLFLLVNLLLLFAAGAPRFVYQEF